MRAVWQAGGRAGGEVWDLGEEVTEAAWKTSDWC